MLAAIIVCGLGYAEGALVALGGWQISGRSGWVVGLALYLLAPSFAGGGEPTWIGLAYVSLFSMLIGFVFWYRGFI